MTQDEKRITGIMLELWDITHFSVEEVFPHEFPPFYMAENIMPSLFYLNFLRVELGAPIIITSSYRSPAKNKAVGGSPNSMHLQNNAIDWQLKRPWADCYRDIAGEISKGLLPARFNKIGKDIHFQPDIMGVGVYDTFMHLDTRGLLHRKAPARWDFSVHKPAKVITL